MNGFFITFYGINNIGKTYHAKKLVARLRKLGKKAVYIKYPVYEQKPTGPLLNRILRSHKQKMPEEELQLWFVLNRYQFEPRLKSLLEKGVIVIAEDYIGTGIAWGMAKGVKQKTLENMNKFLVQPDMAVFMDGERALKVREKKHIHEQNDILVQKCQRIFQKLAKQKHWKAVQVDQDPDVTAARIWALVSRRIFH